MATKRLFLRPWKCGVYSMENDTSNSFIERYMYDNAWTGEFREATGEELSQRILISPYDLHYDYNGSYATRIYDSNGNALAELAVYIYDPEEGCDIIDDVLGYLICGKIEKCREGLHFHKL